MIRRFELHRDTDLSGVSGVGVVAVGVVFPSGRVVLEWQTGRPSLGVHDEIGWVEEVHGHGGTTRVVWLDGAGGDEGSRCMDG